MNNCKTLISFFLAIFSIACSSIDDDAQEGEKLSEQYCQSCHQYPAPDLINKITWANYVLPKMSLLNGFSQLPTGGYVKHGHNQRMTIDEWRKIVHYYISAAPLDPLKRKVNAPIKEEDNRFSVVKLHALAEVPTTTLLAASADHRNFYFADALSRMFYKVSGNGQLVDSFATGLGAANIKEDSNTIWVLTMGVLHPSDEHSGKLVQFDKSTHRQSQLLDSLQRPVHAAYADLNGDGREDIVICEFGNTTGALNWYERLPSDTFRRHVLRPLPGAIKTVIADFNKDGKPDIMALMAQGDESLFVYYNMGNGNFREERLLRFPPSYGSNYFELADMNGDGYPDLIITNGDNGDYPPILKAYHGVRIYLNDGSFHFTEATFLTVNGIGKAIARDFNGDGKPDIATIAFFPDYQHTPKEGFMLWLNDGQGSYTPVSSKQTECGRWLTMDVADIDHDGRPEIMLGSALIPLGDVPTQIMTDWKKAPVSVLIVKYK